ncbi:DNA helicase PriA [Aequorivita sediminis]|uniref:DNA helicase PriA n=1 Tax=Aequorivita sediminis TaxID=3073653 RepID=UPI0028A5B129|nr:DNA helicase PriA [Aequorivita sp. F6058]
MEEISPKKSELKKSCVNCGAELIYAPGTTELKCDYCGYTEEIEPSQSEIQELELKSYLEKMGSLSHSEEITMLHCKNCGANQHIEENYKSLACVYCGSPLIIEDAYTEEWILPGAVLPFQITQQKAHQIFKDWVDSLWFAPNNLKKAAIDPQNTKGLYAPFWTFDAQLHATYSGQRGEYYYVSKTVGSGKNKRTIQERRTRWYSASGSVSGFVDDTLIKASNQKNGVIPPNIARWNLQLLKPFDSSYLSGFITEKYTIPLLEGHKDSNEVTNTVALTWARKDIGGDTQRISSIDVKLTDETFKHILLPVYISTYRFKGKRYNFYVNGQSGIISGDRPYSFWKIFFLVLLLIFIIAIISLFSS